MWVKRVVARGDKSGWEADVDESRDGEDDGDVGDGF